jgi:hypothetical protein
MQKILWLGEELLATQQGLCSMELVSYFVSAAKIKICVYIISKAQWECSNLKN